MGYPSVPKRFPGTQAMGRKPMSRDSMKECRCGRRIPAEWSICAQCERLARLDALDGSAEHRQYRRMALAQANWNRNVKPPLSPEELALLADGISQRAQEQALLGLRGINRMLHDLKSKVRTEIGARKED